MRFLVLAGLWIGSLLASPGEHILPVYQTVTPGLEYAHMVITNEPWSIHVARVNRSYKRLILRPTLAKNHIEGLSSVAEQARATDRRIGQPLVAVNGDFFVIKAGPYQGDPLGLQIVDGELVSGPGQASFWTRGRRAHMETVKSGFEVLCPDGARIPMGLNESPAAKSAVLFTPTFGYSTRATNAFELELERVRRGTWLPLRPDERYRARIKAIHPEGNTLLTPGEAVLTVTTNATNHFAAIAPGACIEFTTRLSKPLGHANVAIGGSSVLLQDSHLLSTNSRAVKNKHLAPRHPRTAMGYNRHYYFLVEVDGRQPELSMGMDLVELAELMKDLGCTDAMNLDGGGSSTFWLNGKIMNSPSDKHERAVANALVVVREPNYFVREITKFFASELRH